MGQESDHGRGIMRRHVLPPDRQILGPVSVSFVDHAGEPVRGDNVDLDIGVRGLSDSCPSDRPSETVAAFEITYDNEEAPAEIRGR